MGKSTPQSGSLSLFDGQVCKVCGFWKLLQKFNPKKGCINGREPRCRQCTQDPEAKRQRDRACYERHRDERAAYRDANRERRNQQCRDWYAANRERAAEYQKQRRKEQAEYVRERDRLWHAKQLAADPDFNRRKYWENPEAYRARSSKHRKRAYQQDPQKFRDATRQWRIDNPEKARISTRNKKARRRAAEGSFSAQEWLDLKARYDFTCLRCRRHEPDVTLTPDHVVPLICGGRNDIGNIQPLCGSCNSSKGKQTVDYRT